MLSIAIRERVVLLGPNCQTVQAGCDITPTWLIPSCIPKNTQGHDLFFHELKLSKLLKTPVIPAVLHVSLQGFQGASTIMKPSKNSFMRTDESIKPTHI